MSPILLKNQLPTLNRGDPNDLVAENLVKITHAFHYIDATGKDLEIESIYQIHINKHARSPKFCDVLITSDLKNISFSADANAYVNGRRAKISAVDGEPSFYSVVPLVGPIPHNFKLRLQYKITQYDPKSFFRLTSSDFLLPARIVSKDSAFGVDRRNPISFADKTNSGAMVHVPSSHFVVGSSEVRQTRRGWYVEPVEAGNFTVAFARQEDWQQNFFQSSRTAFLYLSKKIDSLIEPKSVQAAVKFAWPIYQSKFGTYTRHVTFVEADGPLGGGAIGSNVLALYSMTKIPEDLQQYIKSVSGAPALPSTKDYVEHIYRGSSDPLFDYIATVTIHELGHLYFGFGQATERYPETYQTWFSLGLGIVYDNEIFRRFVGYKPALFQIMEDQWQKKFATIAGIDQRLQTPDTSADKDHGVLPFHRVQLYAHSKASVVLNKLRQCAGERNFDSLVYQYTASGGANDGYLTFRKRLMSLCSKLATMEKELGIL